MTGLVVEFSPPLHSNSFSGSRAELYRRWGCVQRLSSLFIDALSLFELRPFICSNNSLCFPQGESKTETVLLTSTAN